MAQSITGHQAAVLLDLWPSANTGEATGPGLQPFGQVRGVGTAGPEESAELSSLCQTTVHDYAVLQAPLADMQQLMTTCDGLIHVASHVFGAGRTLNGPNGTIISPAVGKLLAANCVFEPVM